MQGNIKTLGICILERGEEILQAGHKNKDIFVVWRVGKTFEGTVVD